MASKSKVMERERYPGVNRLELSLQPLPASTGWARQDRQKVSVKYLCELEHSITVHSVLLLCGG
jgi:hypothetical protein